MPYSQVWACQKMGNVLVMVRLANISYMEYILYMKY
jgi:hypothetical protein